jgi:phage major head subunit gpT-like protein
MPALTPSFLFDFESNLSAIVEDEYKRFSANMWWSKFMKERPSSSRVEIISWLLSTAQIEDLGKMGGNLPFEDLVSKYTTYEPKFSGAGLKLRRPQIEDLDGNGLELGAKWAADIGAQMGYWPQKVLTNMLKLGHLTTLGTAYDGLSFFNIAHPVNPFNTGAGLYANLFTGAPTAPSAGVAFSPGALPIDDSVTVDVALTNLSKAVAAIRAMKMPNGVDPRFLRAATIVAPPRMQARVAQLTNAKFIAQASAGGTGASGSADVEAFISSLGTVEPVIADELAGFESDTTWFLACEEQAASTLGSFVYVNREPFKITYYTGQGGGNGTDADLDRAEELEWHCKGRNVGGYGHPYTFFKIKAA